MPKLLQSPPAPAKPIPKSAPITRPTNTPKPPQAIDKRPKPLDETKMTYPDLEVKNYSLGALGPITWEMAKIWMGWETEKEYEERTKEPLPDFLLKDDSQKIVCWNNLKNRPWIESHCRELAQDILMRNWAGPLTLPNETVNGETIIISRSGQVISGQHRLIALILARMEWWRQQNKWLHLWKTEPVIESLVVFGVSESRDVLKTIDNVAPRTISDVFYTSDVFKNQQLLNAERKELARMLERELQFLWKRTGAGAQHVLNNKNYQTHSSAMEFFNCHKQHMILSLNEIFDINKPRSKTARALSLLKLSPGCSAGTLFLMGCMASDEVEYRNESPPNEKVLDWSFWEKAVEFWKELGDGKKIFGEGTAINPNCGLPEVKQALSLQLEDGEGSLNQPHVNAILARAWALYSANEELGGLPELTGDPNQDHPILNAWGKKWLPIEWDPDKQTNVLIEPMDFGGIDLGERYHEVSQKPDPSIAKEAKRKAAEEKAKKKLEKNKEKETTEEEAEVESDVPPPESNNVLSLREELINLKKTSNCNLVIFQIGLNYNVKDIDAHAVNKITKWLVKKEKGHLDRIDFTKKQYDEVIPKLLNAGHSVGLFIPPTKDKAATCTLIKPVKPVKK